MPRVAFTQKDGKHAIALSYSVDEIRTLAKEGYFLEAFGRLDKMMDQALFGLMHRFFAKENDLVSTLVNEELSGLVAAKTLYKTGKIPKPLYEKIRAFKTDRNVVAHDIYGHYALALRQAGSIKDSDDLVKKADQKAQSALEEGLTAFSDLMGLLNPKK